MIDSDSPESVEAAQRALALLPYWFDGIKTAMLIDLRPGEGMIPKEIAVEQLAEFGFSEDDTERALYSLLSRGLIAIDQRADGGHWIRARREYVDWLMPPASEGSPDPFVATQMQKDILRAL